MNDNIIDHLTPLALKYAVYIFLQVFINFARSQVPPLENTKGCCGKMASAMCCCCPCCQDNSEESSGRVSVSEAEDEGELSPLLQNDRLQMAATSNYAAEGSGGVDNTAVRT